jgi:SAM-dependent methyltransferase
MHCGHAVLCPFPDWEETVGAYSQSYFKGGGDGGYFDYAADELLHRRNARVRLHKIDREVGRRRGLLLDVGAALGFFVVEAQIDGWEATGVEVSDWARDECLRLTGIPLSPSLDEACDVPHRFDVVTMSQVLEHIPDIRGAMKSVHRGLKPGGILFIETWDRASVTARIFKHSWQQITHANVIHLFSKNSILQLLEQVGFCKAEVRIGLKYTSIGFISNLLMHKGVPGGRVWGGFMKSGFLRRLAVPYFLDDLIHVVAIRKPD